MSRVTSATRSRTKTSPVWFSSWATSESASDSKATIRPSALIVGATLGPSPMRALGADTDQHRGALVPVPDEDVELLVGVAGREVRRRRREGHVAPVGADGRVVAVAVARRALPRQTHPLGGALHPVEDEDVLHAVGVARDQRGGGRGEGHVPPVGADGRGEAGPVGLAAVEPQRDQARAAAAAADGGPGDGGQAPQDDAGDDEPPGESSCSGVPRPPSWWLRGGGRYPLRCRALPGAVCAYGTECPISPVPYHDGWAEIAFRPRSLCPPTADG